jgi:Protein of unknown function (DUF1566)
MMKNILLLFFAITILSWQYASQLGKASNGLHIALVIQNFKLAKNITNQSSISDCGHYIGQNFGGGIIFYLDASGCHGLIAAATDQILLTRWENTTLINTAAYADGIGAGEGNTKMIMYKQEPVGGGVRYAAKICDELVIGAYSDWYLPSKYELNLMFYSIGQGAPSPNTNIGGFPESWYWSSTEFNKDDAWIQAFFVGLGFQIHSTKYYDYGVRAIRAF